jgi:hypothetical protein
MNAKGIAITISENGGFVINVTTTSITEVGGVSRSIPQTKTYIATSVDDAVNIVRERLLEIQL